jgi:hypothetical protein
MLYGCGSAPNLETVQIAAINSFITRLAIQTDGFTTMDSVLDETTVRLLQDPQN